MKQNKTILWLMLIFVVLMGGAYLLYQNLGEGMKPTQMETMPPATRPTESQQHGTEGEASPPEPIAAPDFTVYDGEGNPVKLSDFAGKPVVLNFWASWCGPCRSEMPEFDRMHRELGDDVQFLMINMTDGGRETQEKAEGFVQQGGYGFPVFFDKDSEAMLAYGAYSLPTTYFVDANGYVTARAVGAISYDTLLQGIGMIYPEAAPK